MLGTLVLNLIVFLTRRCVITISFQGRNKQIILEKFLDEFDLLRQRFLCFFFGILRHCKLIVVIKTSCEICSIQPQFTSDIISRE